MAFEHIGIGGILRFDEGRAVRSMGRAQRAFAGLNRGVRQFRGGIRQAGMALPMLGMALSAATVPFVMGGRAAANFQHTMAGVQAVTYNTAEDMARLEKRAVDLSIASVFAASEVGGAMEALGRAGFTTAEIMTGVGEVLDTAAAEGMQMAEAARIIASNVRAWNIEASKAGRIADVLALASASANTTIVELAEGLKMATPFARGMGVTFEETVTTLGMLADSGLTATLAGTAFKNAMLKLAAPTGKGTKAIEKMGLVIRDDAGDFIGMEAILKQLATGMNVYGGSVDRTAAMAELFGLRGVAITNILSRLDKATAGTAMTFGEFHERLMGATGSAAKMAATRLDTLIGKLKLIKGSLEAFWITILGPSLKPLATTVQGFIDQFNMLVEAIRFTLMPSEELVKLTEEEKRKLEAIGPVIWAVARGIVDALDTIKRTVMSVITKVGKLTATLGLVGLDPERIREITRMTVSFTALAAVLGPVLLLSAGLGFALQGLTSLIGGMTKMVWGLGMGLWYLSKALVATAIGLISVGAASVTAVSVLGLKGAVIYGWLKIAPAIATALPVIEGVAIAAVALVAIFLGVRREGEGVGTTLKRVWSDVQRGFGQTMSGIVAWFRSVREAGVKAVAPLVRAFVSLVDTLTSILRPVINVIGNVVWQVFRLVGAAIGFVVEAVGMVIHAVGRIMEAALNVVARFRPLFTAIMTVIFYPLKYAALAVVEAIKIAFKILLVVIKVVLAIVMYAILAVIWVIDRVAQGIMFWIGLFAKVATAVRKFTAPMRKGLALISKAIWFIIKLFAKLAAFLIGKVAKAVAKFATGVWETLEPVRNAIQSIVDVVKVQLVKAWEAVVNVITKVATAIRDNVMKPIRWAAGLLADALDAVSRVPGLKQLVGEEGASLILELREFERGEIREPEPPPTGIGDTEAELEARRERPPETVVTVANQPAQINVDAKLEVDGRILARAQSQYEIELGERAGADITPWQRRALVVDASGLVT